MVILNVKFPGSRLSAVIGTSAFLFSTLTTAMLPATAVEFPDGRTAFEEAPRLTRSSAKFNARGAGSTYYFTIDMPEGAGEPLQAVKLMQLRNVNTVRFRNASSVAFKGTRFVRGPEVPLAAVGGSSEPGEMLVVFDTPVLPGERVTIAVQPRRNPQHGGHYQYRVTAFPAGPHGIGQPLGIGRIYIEDD